MPSTKFANELRSGLETKSMALVARDLSLMRPGGCEIGYGSGMEHNFNLQSRGLLEFELQGASGVKVEYAHLSVTRLILRGLGKQQSGAVAGTGKGVGQGAAQPTGRVVG